MEYLWWKWLHVLSATVLFGTGLGTAFYKWWADRLGDVQTQAGVMRIVVLADYVFTTPAIVVQLATGLRMAQLAGYPLDRGWLLSAIVLYFFIGACWLPVVWLQIRMRAMAAEAVRSGTPLPARYHRYRLWWVALGVPAFSAMLVVFYLMIFKPSAD